MALKAGYYGLKRRVKNKLLYLLDSVPADISPDNPIAGKNDVLASIGLLDDTVGWISKNLLRFPYSEGSITRNGITWTVNSDGTITANGTSTADEVFALYDGNTLPRDIPLTIVGGASKNIYLYVNGRKNGQWVKTYAEQAGEPKEFTILSTDDVDEIYVRLRINVNQTVNNLVFYPMICRSDVYALAPVYEAPHASVEEELTAINAELNKNIITDNTNSTTFNIPLVRKSDGYTYGEIIGNNFLYHFFINTPSAQNAVTFNKIYDNVEGRTFSGSYANGVFTITSSATIYGGIMVITSNVLPTLTQSNREISEPKPAIKKATKK